MLRSASCPAVNAHVQLVQPRTCEDFVIPPFGFLIVEDGTFEPGEIIFAPQDGAQLIVVISGQAGSLQTAVTAGRHSWKPGAPGAGTEVAIMKGLAKTREEDELAGFLE